MVFTFFATGLFPSSLLPSSRPFPFEGRMTSFVDLIALAGLVAAFAVVDLLD